MAEDGSVDASQGDSLHETKLSKFLTSIQDENFKIAVVTSGGTSVAMEKAGVRSIENFSTGKRGAVTAEYFLKNDFAVIYLHRDGCLLPFLRTIKDIWPNQLNFFDIFNADSDTIGLRPNIPPMFSKAVIDYTQYKNKLFLITFTSPSDYLKYLQMVCKIIHPLGNRVILYLAAAVSDYYIPDVPQHKIQSGPDNLVLTLKPFPKFLKQIVEVWAANAYVATFKLETDESILLQKARAALKKYNHHIVIGNILETRYHSVVLITKSSETTVSLEPKEIENGVEIEEIIVKKLVEIHNEIFGL